MDLRDTAEYKEFGCKIVICPICGNETLDNFCICEHCYWEYDGTTENNEYSSANGMTVEEYKIKYKAKKLL